MTRDYSLSGDLSLWGQFTLTLSDLPILTYSHTLMCTTNDKASHCEVEPPITYRRHVTDTDITIFSNSRHATDTDNDFLVRCRHGTDTDSQTFKNCRHVCRHRQTADNLVCLTLFRSTNPKNPRLESKPWTHLNLAKPSERHNLCNIRVK